MTSKKDQNDQELRDAAWKIQISELERAVETRDKVIEKQAHEIAETVKAVNHWKGSFTQATSRCLDLEEKLEATERSLDWTQEELTIVKAQAYDYLILAIQSGRVQ